MKIKVITGYRADQYQIIDAEEAHKAYYLFLNPEKRGIFANGVALRGSDIQSIQPAWQETMGWNPTHTLDSDDWNEIRNGGIDRKLQHKILPAAREIAILMKPEEMNRPLSQLLQTYPQAIPIPSSTYTKDSIKVTLNESWKRLEALNKEEDKFAEKFL